MTNRAWAVLALAMTLMTWGAIRPATVSADPARPAAGQATGQPAGRSGRGAPEAGGPFAGRMALTDDQKQKVEAIHAKYQDQRDNLSDQVDEKSLQLRKLFRVAEPDQNAIDGVIDEIISLQGQMQKLTVAELFEIRKILTPDQRKSFTRMMMNRIGKQH